MSLKSLLVSIGVCMLFVSPVVRADDCSDALMAESCACGSPVRSERKQLRGSDKASLSNRQSGLPKGATTHVAKQTKGDAAPSDKLMLQK
jgi:hypothetical protein